MSSKKCSIINGRGCRVAVHGSMILFLLEGCHEFHHNEQFDRVSISHPGVLEIWIISKMANSFMSNIDKQ